jgi:hypothetical protein
LTFSFPVAAANYGAVFAGMTGREYLALAFPLVALLNLTLADAHAREVVSSLRARLSRD